MTETDRIEYKRELSPGIDLEEEAVAFLNRREGGILYIGIDKAGKPVGVKDIDGDILKIKDRLRNNILPSAMGLFDVTADEVGGVKVIKVFFAGVSIPRNKELMRIFRDLELVESLGSGMGYIMQKYGRENFVFLDNFIRMTVPYITKDREGRPVDTVQVADPTVQVKAQVEAQVEKDEKQSYVAENDGNGTVAPYVRPYVTPQVAPPTVQVEPATEQVTVQVRRLVAIMPHEWQSAAELRDLLGITHRPTFTMRYLNPALEQGLIEMSQPNSPRSPTQKYRLTAKGMAARISSSPPFLIRPGP